MMSSGWGVRFNVKKCPKRNFWRVVFYDKDRVLGGGWIQSPGPLSLLPKAN